MAEDYMYLSSQKFGKFYFWYFLREIKRKQTVFFIILGPKVGTKILILFYECYPKIYRFHRNPPKRFFFFFRKCVRRNNHIKSMQSRCERRRVVCLHWTLKKGYREFSFRNTSSNSILTTPSNIFANQQNITCLWLIPW